MLIGVPKEIKNNEFRAGMVPSSVHEAVHRGHQVIVEKNLGAGIGINDDEYAEAGATVVASAKEIFERAEMIVKVKEPQTGRAPVPQARPGPLHLPASCARPRADQGFGRERRRVHRL